MQEKRWEQLQRGVIGTFAPVTDPPSGWYPGMLRVDGGHAEVVFQGADDAMDGDHLPRDCNAVAGRTEAGLVLLTPVTRRTGGIGRSPRCSYNSSALLLDVDFDDIDDDKVVGASLSYQGLYGWCGRKAITNEPIVENGATVGWRAEIRPPAPQVVAIDDAFTLNFSVRSTWSERPDHVTYRTPLRVQIDSASPRSIGDHLQRLDAVHALLSVAHKEAVTATSGSARLTGESAWAPMWEKDYVVFGSEDAHDFPNVGVDEIGADGVAAWVRLVLKHRRAVEPLVRHALFTTQTPESRLFSTAAAIEYWVGTNRRTEQWAAKEQAVPYPRALTTIVHPAWHDWIGDPGFEERFWDIYRGLKHDPSSNWDPAVVHAYEVAGRWLLTAALLDYCSGTTRPSEHLFSKSLSMTGHQIREVLATNP